MLHHIISKQRPYLSKWALLLTLGFATLFLFPESAYAAEAGGGDMWAVGKELIVTNGDQTDTVRDYLLEGRTFAEALKTRTFEPDGPNWTPRISGVVLPDGKYAMSILKSLDGDPACCCRYFFEYENPPAGAGHFISTYQGDGTPLPSFAGEPIPVSLAAGSPEELARALWESLNEDNKVSLFVEYIDLEHGNLHTVIHNKHS